MPFYIPLGGALVRKVRTIIQADILNSVKMKLKM